MDRWGRANDSPVDQALPANLLEARDPSIPHAQAREDLRGPAARQLPAHGPALARAQDSEHAQDLERAQAPAAHHRPAKLHARSARVREAAAEASSSTPRPKKAQ